MTVCNADGTFGRVFDIQKFSLHDGTGIRTLVFLKGCPLACAWCSNPEGQACSAELVYSRDRCLGASACDRCMQACPARAVGQDADGKVKVDRQLCDNCGACADVCPPKAIAVSGELVSVDHVMRVVEEDSGFYVRSGGGLTLSGGEPLAQGEFVRSLLGAARGRGVDAVIETSGLCRWETLAAIAPLVDQVFYDIKCLDAEKHKRTTGVSNAGILENFRRFRRSFPGIPVIVRTPVVPGVNDTEEDIRTIVEFINDAGGAAGYELLPYHRFGEAKYGKLGKTYPLKDIDPPAEKRMIALRRIAARVSS
ncbi:MAG: glycyl-radical enzyme activating protein [Candidatus Binatia bacterium]